MSWTDRNLAVQGYCLTGKESRGLRHLSGAPELPPNSTPRRHAFKLGTIWLLAVGVLFAVGQSTAGLVLGGVLVAVCGRVTATNFCIPSTLLTIWWRWRGDWIELVGSR